MEPSYQVPAETKHWNHVIKRSLVLMGLCGVPAGWIIIRCIQRFRDLHAFFPRLKLSVATLRLYRLFP